MSHRLLVIVIILPLCIHLNAAGKSTYLADRLADYRGLMWVVLSRQRTRFSVSLLPNYMLLLQLS